MGGKKRFHLLIQYVKNEEFLTEDQNLYGVKRKKTFPNPPEKRRRISEQEHFSHGKK